MVRRLNPLFLVKSDLHLLYISTSPNHFFVVVYCVLKIYSMKSKRRGGKVEERRKGGRCWFLFSCFFFFFITCLNFFLIPFEINFLTSWSNKKLWWLYVNLKVLDKRSYNILYSYTIEILCNILIQLIFIWNWIGE